MRVPTRRSEIELNLKRERGPVQITADGLVRLEKKLERMQKDLPALIKEVERTKGHGDFSENAAYQDAKHSMRNMHSRIAHTKDLIKRSVIIKQGKNEQGTVQVGSTVVLETGKKQVTFEILGPHEARPAEGRISDRSPLGQVLLGRKAGEEVELQLKDSSIKYRILEIR